MYDISRRQKLKYNPIYLTCVCYYDMTQGLAEVVFSFCICYHIYRIDWCSSPRFSSVRYMTYPVWDLVSVANRQRVLFASILHFSYQVCHLFIKSFSLMYILLRIAVNIFVYFYWKSSAKYWDKRMMLTVYVGRVNSSTLTVYLYGLC